MGLAQIYLPVTWMVGLELLPATHVSFHVHFLFSGKYPQEQTPRLKPWFSIEFVQLEPRRYPRQVGGRRQATGSGAHEVPVVTSKAIPAKAVILRTKKAVGHPF